MMAKRRTFEEIAAAARDKERDACVAMIRSRIAEVAALASKGSVPFDEADTLNRRLETVAGDLEAGLHRIDPPRKGMLQ